MTPTETLLAFARANHVLPDSARSDAARLLADTLAVGAAGSTAPGADGVLAAARGWGEGREARLIGSSDRLPAPSAAFVNGFRIHCLEWDAVHEPAVVHALSVVTAALGASIDRRGGCAPDDALVALAIGVDVASGLGIAATSPLKFFRPATAGCISAALAVARLERVERLEDVLGLAYSFCSGTMQAHVEGSIALPLQIANAARSAILAVDLVKAGLTGPQDALEGPFGYFNLIDDGVLASYTETIGERWLISEVSTKPYPSGRASHATLATIADWGYRADQIDRIELFVPPLIKRLVGRPMKAGMTPAYARLCMPLLVALMATDGLIDPRRFTSATFDDPAIQDLAARVSINQDTNPDSNALFPQRIRATLKGNKIIQRLVPATLGSPQSPLSATQAAAKLKLIRALAPAAEPRLFDDPLGYFTEIA